jgi:hypothetical protein
MSRTPTDLKAPKLTPWWPFVLAGFLLAMLIYLLLMEIFA